MQLLECYDQARKARIAYLEAEIANLRSIDLSSLPELPGIYSARPNSTNSSEIWLEIPASFVLRDRIRQILEAAGWTLHNYMEFDGWFCYGARHSDLKYRLALAFYAGIEGATCVYRQIDTKEVPVYEWVCQEAISAES